MLATAACATPHRNSGIAAALINLEMMLDAQTPNFTSIPYREVPPLPSDYVAEIRRGDAEPPIPTAFAAQNDGPRRAAI